MTTSSTVSGLDRSDLAHAVDSCRSAIPRIRHGPRSHLAVVPGGSSFSLFGRLPRASRFLVFPALLMRLRDSSHFGYLEPGGTCRLGRATTHACRFLVFGPQALAAFPGRVLGVAAESKFKAILNGITVTYSQDVPSPTWIRLTGR